MGGSDKNRTKITRMNDVLETRGTGRFRSCGGGVLIVLHIGNALGELLHDDGDFAVSEHPRAL